MRLNEISTLCNVTYRDCPGRVCIQKSQIEIAKGGYAFKSCFQERCLI